MCEETVWLSFNLREFFMDQSCSCSGLQIRPLAQNLQDPAPTSKKRQKERTTGHLTLLLYYHYPLRLMTNSNMEKLLLKQTKCLGTRDVGAKRSSMCLPSPFLIDSSKTDSSKKNVKVNVGIISRAGRVYFLYLAFERFCFVLHLIS